MSIVELERGSTAESKLRVIDCDIHPAMTSWTEVHPYLAKQWIEHLSVYGSHLRHAFSEALTHPRMSPDAARVDAYPEEGGPPGSSLDLMRTHAGQLLDQAAPGSPSTSNLQRINARYNSFQAVIRSTTGSYAVHSACGIDLTRE